MKAAQMTTYRGRGYQRVTHEGVLTPLDYHALRYHSIPHRRMSSVESWSLTSGDPNRPTRLSIMEAVSAAVVDLVGNSSTCHLEEASMITRIYSLPFASLANGPI